MGIASFNQYSLNIVLLLKKMTMIEMWNKRFAQDEYVYGKEPNVFFKEQLLRHPSGKILLPAEGEGRNAVFAAKMGWNVDAFDTSIEAKKKAERLAQENNVQIKYHLYSYEEADYKANSFDLIALVYAHSSNRKQNHQRLIKFLKPGGIIILEGFSKKQINNSTGGPRNAEMLFSKEELEDDFNTLSELLFTESDIDLDEGEHHNGTASIIRLIGKK